MNQSDPIHHPLAIAIIGMGLRFPGASNPDAFWHNLQHGIESITHFTDEDLIAQGVPSHLLDNPDYVKAGSVLENFDQFDADFFNFTPKEAEMTDPQHRLFLECAWETLEHAGYTSEQVDTPIGLYAGATANTYLAHIRKNEDFVKYVNGYQAFLANERDYLTTRVSYKLNLKGPSITIQTACSTSLVAVHLACQSLLNGECDMALAGGVTINANPKIGYIYQDGGIRSPDGHCRAFSAQAQGTVFGNGVGTILLKRYEDAVADGDNVLAIIRGSAVNNDGALKVGYTAPSVDGQAQVIAEALALADVEPNTIQYIETHGTGTELGDPIEVSALVQAFQANTQQKQFCAIGSVKTNVGHLDSAAGVAGLIKTVLALQNKQIPPSLHCEEPHPSIQFDQTPFYVNTTLTHWPNPNNTPRRAGVSSFGIGGTNAHIVLEEAPPTPAPTPTQPQHLFPLSAKTEAALQQASHNLINYLKDNPNSNLADVAYTLQVGRQAFTHRRAFVATNHQEAVTTLERLLLKNQFHQCPQEKQRPIIFMFPGQGTQYIYMAQELYQTEPTFRDHLNHCADLLQPQLNLDPRHLLYPPEHEAELATEQLKQTAITQPLLFAVQYALAQLLLSWGLQPHAIIGHSLGEYVAATLAGVFSLEAALTLVVARGKFMQQLPSGSMVAVSRSPETIQPFLTDQLTIAAINGPSRCVISGTTTAVDQLETTLNQQNITYRRLHTSHAFHSPMMEPILEPFTKLIQQIERHAPQIPYLSNVTGTWITAESATDPTYWAKHLRQTVQFNAGLEALLQEPEWVLLEVGPGQTLTTFAKQHPHKSKTHCILATMRHPRETYTDRLFLLNTISQLWQVGASIDWPAFHQHHPCQRIPLPTYPFQHQRYWIDPTPKPTPSPQESTHPATTEAIHTNGHHTNGTTTEQTIPTPPLTSSVTVPTQTPSTNQPTPSTPLHQLLFLQVDIINQQLTTLQKRQQTKRGNNHD